MLVDGGNTITILNPTFETVGTPVKHISGSPFIGIIDATSRNSGTTYESTGYASILIDNLNKDNDSDTVKLPSGTALGKSRHVDTFTYGNTVGRSPVYGATTSKVARPAAVAPGGRIPAIAAPSYADSAVGDVVNIKDPKQNGGYTINGDGEGNEVEALTSALQYAAKNNKIAYFPFGDYRIASTLLFLSALVSLVKAGPQSRLLATISNTPAIPSLLYVSVLQATWAPFKFKICDSPSLKYSPEPS